MIKWPVKVRVITESAQSIDLGGRRTLNEEVSGIYDSLLKDKTVNGNTGFLLEEPGKIVTAQVNGRGQIFQTNVFVDMVINILNNLRGQLAVCHGQSDYL